MIYDRTFSKQPFKFIKMKRFFVVVFHILVLPNEACQMSTRGPFQKAGLLKTLPFIYIQYKILAVLVWLFLCCGISVIT